jgi:D-sedoheptulose 7-phosphate isomerase
VRSSLRATRLSDRLDELVEARSEANRRFFADEADRVARLCHRMAERFARGGRLVALGRSPAARSDVRHVAVEFVHPVIVGKRALPAISLTTDMATVTGIANRLGFDEVFAHQLRHLAGPQDIALGISVDGRCRNVLRGFETAHAMEMLTIALVGGDGGPIAGSSAVDHVLVARSDVPQVVKEVHVTMYHVLWELVHVFLEQPGLLETGAIP